MVADGVTRDDIEMASVEDIRLPVSSNERWRVTIDGWHEIITYLDADDILEPNCVKKVLRTFDVGFDGVGVQAQRVITSSEPRSLEDGSVAVT